MFCFGSQPVQNLSSLSFLPLCCFLPLSRVWNSWIQGILWSCLCTFAIGVSGVSMKITVFGDATLISIFKFQFQSAVDTGFSGVFVVFGAASRRKFLLVNTNCQCLTCGHQCWSFVKCFFLFFNFACNYLFLAIVQNYESQTAGFSHNDECSGKKLFLSWQEYKRSEG